MSEAIPEHVCVLTGVTITESASSDDPDRDLSVNVMVYGDGTARVYERNKLDPRLTGAAYNRGKQTTDVPYFDSIGAAIDYLIAMNGESRTRHPVQVPAQQVRDVLNMRVATL